MEHVMEVPNPNEHLLERILSTENVKAAWKRVKANKGKPGFDRVTIVSTDTRNGSQSV